MSVRENVHLQRLVIRFCYNTDKCRFSVLVLQIGLLATLCYNCGVGSFQKRQFEEATLFLKESFDIGKIENAVSPKDQVPVISVCVNGMISTFVQLILIANQYIMYFHSSSLSYAKRTSTVLPQTEMHACNCLKIVKRQLCLVSLFLDLCC